MRKWQVIVPVLVCVEAEEFSEASVKADRLVESRRLYPFTHPGERTSDVSEADDDSPIDFEIVIRAW